MKKIEVWLMSRFWKVWNTLSGYRGGLRCNGYRQVGYVNGERTHMAQYCLRFRSHGGRCLARINARGEFVPALFDDEGES